MVTKDKQWWTFEVLGPSMIYNGYNCSKYTLNFKFRISQSFDLPSATPSYLPHHCVTASVSHLTCPLPPHHIYCITTLVSHFTCPLSPHHIYHITALPHYHVSHLTCPLPPHHIHHVTALPHYHVSHLTCLLPPHHIYGITPLPC